MTNNSGIIMPHNEQIERAILGEILIEEKIGDAAQIILEDFYFEKHQNIFRVCQELNAAGLDIDILSVTAKLNGYAAELTAMVNESGSPALLKSHVRILKELTAKREKVKEALQVLDKNKEGTLEIELPQEVEIAGPKPLDAFLKSDIPQIEYYIEPILPVKGKVMISAATNVGKSMLALNLCLAMTCGFEKVFDKWTVKPARVLYIDLEMGNSPMKERFSDMCKAGNLTTPSLFVVHLPGMNILDAAALKMVEGWIREHKVDVLVLDPVGCSWAGDENDAQEVNQLTTCLNQLIDKYNLSVVLLHHWRKATKDFQEGGQMAAGSHKWTDWLDMHICMSGEAHNITISCGKNRHSKRFDPWIAKINTDSLWLEHIADCGKKNSKINDLVLLELFDSFRQQEVYLSEMVNTAIQKGICKSANTVKDGILKTKCFKISGEGKKRLIRKVETQEEFLQNPDLSETGN